MMRLLFVSLLLCSMSSCLVISHGNTGSGPLLSTRDTYVDIASGICKSYSVFGISGMHKKNMILQAKADLFKNRPLKPGEYYSNFSVDFTKTFVFMVYLSRTVVSAEVLRSADTSAAPFTPEFKKSIQRRLQAAKGLGGQDDAARAEAGNGKLLTAGGTVYYSREGRSYGIYRVSEVDKENVMLQAIDPKDQNILVGVQNLFFNRKEEINGYRTGSRVKAELINEYNAAVYEDGQVLGVAGNTVLVKTKSGLHALSTFRCKKIE